MAARDGSDATGDFDAGIEAAKLGSTGMTQSTVQYVNRVFDPGGGGVYVSWRTLENADATGADYPDPYGSGFAACSDFVVTAVLWD